MASWLLELRLLELRLLLVVGAHHHHRLLLLELLLLGLLLLGLLLLELLLLELRLLELQLLELRLLELRLLELRLLELLLLELPLLGLLLLELLELLELLLELRLLGLRLLGLRLLGLRLLELRLLLVVGAHHRHRLLLLELLVELRLLPVTEPALQQRKEPFPLCLPLQGRLRPLRCRLFFCFVCFALPLPLFRFFRVLYELEDRRVASCGRGRGSRDDMLGPVRGEVPLLLLLLLLPLPAALGPAVLLPALLRLLARLGFPLPATVISAPRAACLGVGLGLGLGGGGGGGSLLGRTELGARLRPLGRHLLKPLRLLGRLLLGV